MFERFSEPARQAVVEAHQAARGLGHPFIAPEHLRLGLMRVGASGAASEAKLTEEVVAALGPPAGETDGQIPFRPEAQRCLERATELTANTVTPGHILRALLDEKGIEAILERCGADVERVRSVEEPPADVRHPIEVRLGDELIGDLGNPRTDVHLIAAILGRNGLAAGWLRASGVDAAWVREFGGE